MKLSDLTIDAYINILELDTTDINLSDSHLTQIPDLTRFTKLEHILLYNNNIATLPKLPNSIKRIKAYRNKITDISNVVNYPNLEYLDVSNNNLTTIPNLSNLKKLTVLHCSENKITNIVKLPNNLDTLVCRDNKLKKIKYFPNKLRALFCSNNQLTTLPQFGRYLDRVQCYDNKLTKLPKLNKKLRILYCFNNKLTHLPDIAHTKLIDIFCHNNYITHIPELNAELRELGCSNNNIITLPTLHHNLSDVFIDNNPITKLLMECIIGHVAFGAIENEIEDIDEGINIANNIEIINKVNLILQKFKFSYYCAKYKKQFRRILWERIRERRIMEQYSPMAIYEQIAQCENLEDALDAIHGSVIRGSSLGVFNSVKDPLLRPSIADSTGQI